MSSSAGLGVAVTAGDAQAPTWLEQLDSLADRHGFRELQARAHLHHARLGDTAAQSLAEMRNTLTGRDLRFGLVGMRDHFGRFDSCGYKNIETRIANGEHGWPERAPFDKIVVCAACELVPATLIGQLKPGGKMVIPAGLQEAQTLMVVEKNPEGRVRTKEVLPVRFALMETAN